MAVTFTATPDVSNARVVINAQGGVTGQRFYMVRRDQNGSNLIRETSETGALWQKDPAKVRTNLSINGGMEGVGPNVNVRTNLATNPAAASTTNYAAVAGTGGTAALTNVASQGRNGGNCNRTTWSVATTAPSGGQSYLQTGLAANTPHAMSIWVRSTKAQTVVLKADFQTSASALVNTVSAAGVALVANTWTQLWVTGTAGAAVDRVLLTASVSAGVVWAVNDTFDMDDVLIETGSVLNPNFDGTTPAAGDFSYAWTGTANASTSTQRIASVSDTTSGGSAAGSSTDWKSSGSRSVRIIPTSTSSQDSYASPGGDTGAIRYGLMEGKTYTISATCRLTAALTGALATDSRKIVVNTKVGAAAYVKTVSAAAPNALGVTRLSVTVTIPAGATEAFIRLYNGAGKNGGDVWWDDLLVEEAATDLGFFDGSTNSNTAWTGTANASTSTNSAASLPITLNDYEARQGMDVDYIITDENGMTSDSKRITIPKWGTWLKDPFRPFMNVKVLWNADSEYSRPVERVILKARGAKFPVVQHERRMAPNGTVRIATETNDVSKALIALLDMTNIIMLDVDASFGVPVRYVSVGDLSGKRVGKEDSDLSWEARYWDLPIQEVAIPVGVPVAQSLTYDMLASNFGSYIAIPASVDTYNDLAQGVWS